jgi:very-short-patch-repair endonuclease
MHPLLPLAKKFRKEHTPAELTLWLYLRKKQIKGIKFKRQIPIGNYIVDFASIEHKLIIEIDGGQHNEEEIKQYDNERTKFLESQGYKVIRVWNDDIKNNLSGVLEVLHLSLPSPQGED